MAVPTVRAVTMDRGQVVFDGCTFDRMQTGVFHGHARATQTGDHRLKVALINAQVSRVGGQQCVDADSASAAPPGVAVEVYGSAVDGGVEVHLSSLRVTDCDTAAVRMATVASSPFRWAMTGSNLGAKLLLGYAAATPTLPEKPAPYRFCSNSVAAGSDWTTPVGCDDGVPEPPAPSAASPLFDLTWVEELRADEPEWDNPTPESFAGKDLWVILPDGATGHLVQYEDGSTPTNLRRKVVNGRRWVTFQSMVNTGDAVSRIMMSGAQSVWFKSCSFKPGETSAIMSIFGALANGGHYVPHSIVFDACTFQGKADGYPKLTTPLSGGALQTWAAGTTYAANSAVQRLGVAYYNVATSTGQAPESTPAVWKKVNQYGGRLLRVGGNQLGPTTVGVLTSTASRHRAKAHRILFSACSFVDGLEDAVQFNGGAYEVLFEGCDFTDCRSPIPMDCVSDQYGTHVDGFQCGSAAVMFKDCTWSKAGNYGLIIQPGLDWGLGHAVVAVVDSDVLDGGQTQWVSGASTGGGVGVGAVTRSGSFSNGLTFLHVKNVTATGNDAADVAICARTQAVANDQRAVIEGSTLDELSGSISPDIYKPPDAQVLVKDDCDIATGGTTWGANLSTIPVVPEFTVSVVGTGLTRTFTVTNPDPDVTYVWEFGMADSTQSKTPAGWPYTGTQRTFTYANSRTYGGVAGFCVGYRDGYASRRVSFLVDLSTV